MIRFCEKEDGRIVPFDKRKILNAINASFSASDEGNRFLASEMTESVIEILIRSFPYEDIPSVGEIEDIIEEALMDYNFRRTAKHYILLRKEKENAS
ncbi:hypothetical protein IMZ31_20465 (plasmid) [Pontibacillus sp. ALD_SL1]|uniref:ATP cone domain-containing protein n=1 Tax=Pontibacillus sp. ALD_SL1 TaxID=2777185 RepID=UPI001A9729E6|nr:ATP cone domain-containing protein [Pontibacillus sp. ALD_SL1]QST02924.1 hypothetical protein IMZ31_20465 [Pontibacillus sp. ALD_SL1]